MYQATLLVDTFDTFKIGFANPREKQHFKFHQDDFKVEKPSRSSVRITINNPDRSAPSGCLRADVCWTWFWKKKQRDKVRRMHCFIESLQQNGSSIVVTCSINNKYIESFAPNQRPKFTTWFQFQLHAWLILSVKELKESPCTICFNLILFARHPVKRTETETIPSMLDWKSVFTCTLIYSMSMLFSNQHWKSSK